MPKWMIGLLVAVALSGAKMALHQPVATTPEHRADLIATAMDAVAPKQLGPSTLLTGAHADGRAVEIDARMTVEMPRDFSQDDFRRAFTAVTCKEKSITDFIAQGGTLRYALTTQDGRALDPISVTGCAA